MAIQKEKKSHIWDRDPNDWYVEPYECSLALFDLETFEGKVWDPACGRGNILRSAISSNIDAIGTDIVVRNESCSKKMNFLEEEPDFEFQNIVSNPPFGVAEDFVRKSIEIVPAGGKVAMILPMVWLSGFSSKRDWLPYSPLKKYFSISPRPSMPPGAVIEAGVKAGNGTKDFAWFVWEKDYCGDATVGFMNTKHYKRKALKLNGQSSKVRNSSYAA